MRLFLQSMAGCVVLLLAGASRAFSQAASLSDFTQVPIIQSWGTEVGLPQNAVNAIAQTRDGYLWLGTHDGLARFDGVRFKVFLASKMACPAWMS
jgi:ligand-binding sensor domain-containing protein